MGEQPLGTGGAVIGRPAVVLHRLLGVRSGSDTVLIAHAQIAQGGQAAHLHRLLVEPDGLAGIGLHADPLLHAQPQIAGAPAAAHLSGLPEALQRPRLVAVLLHPEHSQGRPGVSGELVLLRLDQGRAALRAALGHGVPLPPEAAVIFHTVINHRAAPPFSSPLSRMR